MGKECTPFSPRIPRSAGMGYRRAQQTEVKAWRRWAGVLIIFNFVLKIDIGIGDNTKRGSVIPSDQIIFVLV